MYKRGLLASGIFPTKTQVVIVTMTNCRAPWFPWLQNRGTGQLKRKKQNLGKKYNGIQRALKSLLNQSQCDNKIRAALLTQARLPNLYFYKIVSLWFIQNLIMLNKFKCQKVLEAHTKLQSMTIVSFQFWNKTQFSIHVERVMQPECSAQLTHT